MKFLTDSQTPHKTSSLAAVIKHSGCGTVPGSGSGIVDLLRTVIFRIHRPAVEKMGGCGRCDWATPAAIVVEVGLTDGTARGITRVTGWTTGGGGMNRLLASLSLSLSLSARQLLKSPINAAGMAESPEVRTGNSYSEQIT